MSDADLAHLVSAAEAVLFATADPLPVDTLGRILGITDRDRIAQIVEALEALYDRQSRGIVLQRVAAGLRLATAARYEPYVLDALKRISASRLSQAALEVLAIVAYRQPITIPEINAIRGVNSSSVVETLTAHHLIKPAGRKQVVGRPYLYRTTKAFLIHFGLDSLEDLPPVEEDGAVAAE